MRSPIFRPAAAADVEDAYLWYEKQRSGLGEEFLASLSACIESILQNAQQYPIVHRNTRRALLRRFPYGVFYRVTAEQILVVACFHARRHPRLWRSRR